jgi:hypothetical protein
MQVWYVAYGSNMCAARIRCYLRGGMPRGGRCASSGGRDRRMPSAHRRFRLPHPLLFAGPSRVWRGGPAFLDTHRRGHAEARGWLLAVTQLEDLLAQENRVPVGSVTATETLLHAGGVAVPRGRYGRLVAVASPDDLPAVTFTFVERPAPRAPDPAYLDHIRRGLAETGLGPEEITAYLQAHPQVASSANPP